MYNGTGLWWSLEVYSEMAYCLYAKPQGSDVRGEGEWQFMTADIGKGLGFLIPSQSLQALHWMRKTNKITGTSV